MISRHVPDERERANWEKEDAKNRESDMRMKYGKNWQDFSRDSNEARTKLRPGEVKKWNPRKKKWVSNKD